MTEQDTLSETKASTLIAEPRFGLGEAWHAPALAEALSCSAPFGNAQHLSNAIRTFMCARATPAGIDRFLKLWTAVNCLRNHIAERFEAAQAIHLHLEPGKLPRRYCIQTMDYLSLSAFALLIDRQHPLPEFGDLRSKPFRDAQHTLGRLAENLLDECRQNPRGALAQLIEEPAASASKKPHAYSAEAPTATKELFALAKEVESSPLVFVMLLASYELRNGLLHGSIPLPLIPNEQCEELRTLDLFSLVLDEFLDQTLPQVVQQLDADDGSMAPFPEAHRQTIEHYLDHRFDRHGISGFLRKHGLIW